jgi:hypothetical protein
MLDAPVSVVVTRKPLEYNKARKTALASWLFLAAINDG